MTNSKLGGLLHRQIRGFGALEDAIHVRRGAPEDGVTVRVIGHEAARYHLPPEFVDAWQSGMVASPRCLNRCNEERVLKHQERPAPSRVIAAKAPSNSSGVSTSTIWRWTPSDRRPPLLAAGVPARAGARQTSRAARAAGYPRHSLQEQLQAFRVEFQAHLVGYAGEVPARLRLHSM
jgi:hypothetical protein